jgi:hypothetical protein
MFVLMKECPLIVDIDRSPTKKEFREIIVFNKQRKNNATTNICAGTKYLCPICLKVGIF